MPSSGELWFDIGDIATYFAHHTNPTGIQRVVLETIGAARQQSREFHLCRLTDSGRVIELPLEWLDAARTTLTSQSMQRAAGRAASDPTEAGGAFRDLLAGSALVSRALLPRPLHDSVVSFAKRLVNEMPTQSLSAIARARRLNGMGTPAVLGRRDILVSLGAPWSTPGHEIALAAALDASGARYGFLSYDLLPVSHPHFFPPDLHTFIPWLEMAVRRACYAQAISRHTSSALDLFREKAGAARFPIDVIRLGDNIPAPQAAAPLPAGLETSSYFLCVSTIEPRKNHRLLFDAWLLLREQLGAACPRLVWVGRNGWLCNDLLGQMNACNWLDGLIVHLPQVCDAELAALYRHSTATIYPSIVEGWGLPVGESFAHGKVCLAAQSSSLPEVGGDLALYFDPHNATALAALVSQLLRAPDAIREREQKIRANWKPTSWADCAAQVLQGFHHALDR